MDKEEEAPPKGSKTSKDGGRKKKSGTRWAERDLPLKSTEAIAEFSTLMKKSATAREKMVGTPCKYFSALLEYWFTIR